MSEIQNKTRETLQWAAGILKNTPFIDTAELFEKLNQQVDDPCVVAVTGLVKAGKSTFINALMQADLAKVGVNETTATINYFRYGTPPDPNLPVRCYWRSGREYTWESREFLDSLQGNDLDTLKKAINIERLEFYLPNTILQNITLVDTPGLGAVVDEHQDRTAEYLNLEQQLRTQHDQATRTITSEKTDAVIFLVGEVARSTYVDILGNFREVTGGSKAMALNAIGVMAKVDKDANILEQRFRLCEKIAGQMKDELNTVLPVSAGLQRALDEFLQNGNGSLENMQKTLQLIPRDLLLEILLTSPELYILDDPSCPVSVQERNKIRGEIPWTVFTLIARTLVENPLDEALQKLREYAGFDDLRTILDRHFFERGQVIRCYRIVHDAYQAVERLIRQEMYSFSSRQMEDVRKKERFLKLLNSPSNDRQTAQELKTFIEEHLLIQPVEEIQEQLDEVFLKLDILQQQLIQHNLDFSALQILEETREDFSQEELQELRLLFGEYGLENEQRVPQGKLQAVYLQGKQKDWQVIVYQTPQNRPRRKIAERARDKYGEMIYDLLQENF